MSLVEFGWVWVEFSSVWMSWVELSFWVELTSVDLRWGLFIVEVSNYSNWNLVRDMSSSREEVM